MSKSFLVLPIYAVTRLYCVANPVKEYIRGDINPTVRLPV